MRRVGCVVAIAAAVLAGTACDTSQPTVGSSANVGVQIDARAQVELFDCYDRYIGTTFDRIVCTGPAPGTGLVDRLVPWRYSFRVVLVHGGAPNDFEIVGNSISGQNGGTFATFGDVTRFDTVTESAPLRNDEPPYNFQNARRVSAGNQDYFLGTISYTDGRPDRQPIALPEVNILGVTPPSPGVAPTYELELHSGDSVIVEAAKQLRAQGPAIFPASDPHLALNARLFVNGSQATPTSGTVQSDIVDGAGISFRFVSQ